MHQLDLMLVNAPSRPEVYQNLSPFTAIEPPVWAGLIARHCLNQGFSVKILDAEARGLTPLETAEEIIEKRPRLAVFCIYGHQPSASTQSMSGAIETAAYVLRLRGDDIIPKTLALGTHPAALPALTLREGVFDFVCDGEGHRSIACLLRRGDRATPGLWLKSTGRKSFGVLPQAKELDWELPNQAWELLDMRRYRPHNWHSWSDPTPAGTGGYASVQTSLGCPFKCSFCCINAPFEAPGFRTWSPLNVASQIEKLVSTYSIRNIKIPDEMFVLNPKHVREICEKLIYFGLGDQLNLWAYARIDTVKDRELLDLMRKAGFRWLALGIESGSKHVRDGIEKGRFGDDDIRAACARVRAAGMHIVGNYIFGLPDDDERSMQQTFDLALELNTAHANFYCSMAYPGSELHRRWREKGWPLPESEGGPGWIGYSQHAYESRPLDTEHVGYRDVLDFRDEAVLKYFERPDYQAMIQKEFGTRAVDDVQRMVAMGKPPRKHRDPDYQGEGR